MKIRSQILLRNIKYFLGSVAYFSTLFIYLIQNFLVIKKCIFERKNKTISKSCLRYVNRVRNFITFNF